MLLPCLMFVTGLFHRLLPFPNPRPYLRVPKTSWNRNAGSLSSARALVVDQLFANVSSFQDGISCRHCCCRSSSSLPCLPLTLQMDIRLMMDDVLFNSFGWIFRIGRLPERKRWKAGMIVWREKAKELPSGLDLAGLPLEAGEEEDINKTFGSVPFRGMLPCCLLGRGGDHSHTSCTKCRMDE